MIRRGAAVVAAAALLTACSSGSVSSEPPVARSPEASSPRPTAVVTPTADPQTSRLQALAQLAEQQAAALPSVSATPTTAPEQPVLGADISWPQCPKGMGIPERRTLGLPMPLPKAAYVVVGLTNGPGFNATLSPRQRACFSSACCSWSATATRLDWWGCSANPAPPF